MHQPLQPLSFTHNCYLLWNVVVVLGEADDTPFVTIEDDEDGAKIVVVAWPRNLKVSVCMK